MERPEPDFYELLQVHPKASAEVVKKAYRTLLLTQGAHPDQGGDPALAARLTEAYHTLCEPERRRAYDAARAQGKRPAEPAPPPPAASRVLRCASCLARNRLSPDKLAVARCARCHMPLSPASGRLAGARLGLAALWRRVPERAKAAAFGVLLLLGLASLTAWVAAPHLAPALERAGELKPSGRYAQAAQALERALQHDPLNARLHEKLGDLYRLQKRPAAALGEYQLASRINPANAYLLTLQGHALGDLEQSEGAEAAYRRALALDPEQAAALVALGNALAKKERFGEAARAYQQALSFAPSAEVLCSLAAAQRWDGAFEAAERHFRLALARDPRHRAALVGLGETLHEQGRLAEAAAALEQASRLQHRDPSLHARLAEIYEKLGRRASAEKEWRLTLAQAHRQPGLQARARRALARYHPSAG